MLASVSNVLTFACQPMIAFRTNVYNNVHTLRFAKYHHRILCFRNDTRRSVSPSEALLWHRKCVKFLCAPYYGLFNVVNAAHTLIARLTLTRTAN